MKKINIVELLKNCPQGMELDCTMLEGLEFDYINEEGISAPICCRLKDSDGRYKTYNFTKYGCWYNLEYAKCVIFPKGKTTWEGFTPPCKFKDGDIVATKTGSWIGITVGGVPDKFIPTYCVIKSDDTFEAYFDIKGTWCFDRLATEEEKQKLFDIIKANDYRWNAETKTLEKLVEPKFKVGDKVQQKEDIREKNIIDNVLNNCYTVQGYGVIFFTDQDEWELAPNKFDITTLKPFESRVLVRNCNSDYWKPAIFGFIGKDKNAPFCVEGGNFFDKCIPYEGNEHLLSTRKDCDEYYKVWE